MISVHALDEPPFSDLLPGSSPPRSPYLSHRLPKIQFPKSPNPKPPWQTECVQQFAAALYRHRGPVSGPCYPLYRCWSSPCFDQILLDAPASSPVRPFLTSQILKVCNFHHLKYWMDRCVPHIANVCLVLNSNCSVFYNSVIY